MTGCLAVRSTHNLRPMALAPLVVVSWAMPAIAASATVAATANPAPRAGDERLFLTPSPLTMPAGSLQLSSDQVLLWRLAAGVHRRLQLDLWFGAVPIAAAGVLPLGHAGLIGGGAVGVVGAFSAGAKFAILEETPTTPALTLSYDMINIFGVGVGAVAAAAGNSSDAATGVASANVQLNHVLLTVGKHLGDVTLLTAGVRVIDNHHFISQSAQFRTAGAVDASGSTTLSRLPTTISGWVGARRRLGDYSAVAAEVLPDTEDLAQSQATLGIRWVLGASEAWHGLPIHRIKLRVDLFAVVLGTRDADTDETHIDALPWLGVGLHII